MLGGSPRLASIPGNTGNGEMDKDSGLVDAVGQGGLHSLGTDVLLNGAQDESDWI